MLKRTLGLLVFFPMLCLAHPHAFIDMTTKVLVENDHLIGFSMQWTLDEPSSASILYDLKQSVTEKQKQKLIDEAMNNIINEHYFSYLFDKHNNKVKYKSLPLNYGIKSTGLQVLYYFDFFLSKPQTLKNNRFELTTYDPTYFVAMTYPTSNQSAVDFSALPTQCHGKIIDPNVDEKVRQYAASLDRSQRDEDNSLGAMFSQKLEILCD